MDISNALNIDSMVLQKILNLISFCQNSYCLTEIKNTCKSQSYSLQLTALTVTSQLLCSCLKMHKGFTSFLIYVFMRSNRMSESFWLSTSPYILSFFSIPDCMVAQVGRDITGSLIQPPAQNRASLEVRYHFSSISHSLDCAVTFRRWGLQGEILLGNLCFNIAHQWLQLGQW